MTAPASGRIQPPARGWVWPVLVLAFCHAEAMAAFQILNVLVEPIKASIHVTDTQYSLMQGLAVAVFASLLGIPAAMIADRGRRVAVVTAGVVIWSAATFGCAFAHSFGQFFSARMLVGLGEVFLFPAALSIIADVAPEKRMASAIGLFGCGGPVGTAVALIGGGWLAGPHTGLLAHLPLLFGEMWRTAFLLCGALGAVAVGLLLTLKEPGRERRSLLLHAPLGDTFAHLGRIRASWLGVSAGMVALSFCVFATSAWAPTVLVRVHAMSYAEAGRITGFAALAGGVVGAWAAGVVTDRVGAGGRRDAALLVSIGVAALILITVVAAVLSPLAGAAALFLSLAYALLGMPTVLAGTALQQISPPTVRAQVMAIQVLLVNLLALSLGPWSVAVLTDHLFHRPSAVGWALAWADGVGALVAIAALLYARRRFSEQRV